MQLHECKCAVTVHVCLISDLQILMFYYDCKFSKNRKGIWWGCFIILDIHIYIHMMRSKYKCASNEDPRQNIKLVTVRLMKK